MIISASKEITGIKKIFAHPSWALIAAFGTYFCMYGFRKPYTAATYTNAHFFGIEYKFLLIIAQTIGYVMAKWLGVKIISEIRPEHRIRLLILLIAFAECMLLLFAIVPRPWNISCMLLNGLSLGMVFGLILGFLEGKKNTELLIAGLCASFIVSDGVSKSIGTMLLSHHISENWMPFFAGLLFLIPTSIFVIMLNYVPAPTEADIVERSARAPMRPKDRWNFFIKYAPGIAGITIVYLFVTLLRSVRADFAPELWKDLGYPQTPSLFTRSELMVSFGVIVINGLCIFILNHHRAFRLALFTCLGGFLVLLAAVYGLHNGLGKFNFMVLLGVGVYLPYVAIHTTVFERLIAITRKRANVGFLMYLVDAVGYTGYIMLMFFRYFTPPGESILSLFLQICFYLSVFGGLIILYCSYYFKIKFKRNGRLITMLSPRVRQQYLMAMAFRLNSLPGKFLFSGVGKY